MNTPIVVTVNPADLRAEYLLLELDAASRLARRFGWLSGRRGRQEARERVLLASREACELCEKGGLSEGMRDALMLAWKKAEERP